MATGDELVLVIGDREVELAAGETVVGRSPECDVVVDAPGVHAQHLSLTVERGTVVARDLSPEGDAVVDGEAIGVVEMQPGDTIEIGAASLELVAGPAGASGGRDLRLRAGVGAEQPLQPGLNVLGRDPRNAVVIDDVQASRRHAELKVEEGRVWARDLASSNGTLVNGRRLGEKAVTPGSKLRLGSVELELRKVMVSGPIRPGHVGRGPQPPRVIIEHDGERVELAPGEHLIGRVPEAKLLVDQPGVSRRHATVTVGDRFVMVRDLGSSNGTFVNGTRVADPVELSDGDELRVGDAPMMVRIDRPAPAPVRAAAAPTALVPSGRPPAPSPPSPPPAPSKPAAPPPAPSKPAAPPPAAPAGLADRDLGPRMAPPRPAAPGSAPPRSAPSSPAEGRRGAPAAAAVRLGELPSALPIRTGPAGPTGSSGHRQRDLAPAAPRASAEVAPSAFPLSAVVFTVLALLLAGVTAVMFRGYTDAQGGLARARGRLEETKRQVAELQSGIVGSESRLEALAAGRLTLLDNGHLKVCNLSEQDMRLAWVGVVYQSGGALQKWNSAFASWRTWDLRPRQSQSFEHVSGDRVVWDGSVLFYSILINYRGEELYVAGPWASQDDCLKLALDG